MSDMNAGTAPAAESGPAKDKFTHENYPEQTPGQLDQLRKGKLPGEMKLQAVTLLLALLATVLSVTALAVALG